MAPRRILAEGPFWSEQTRLVRRCYGKPGSEESKSISTKLTGILANLMHTALLFMGPVEQFIAAQS